MDPGSPLTHNRNPVRMGLAITVFILFSIRVNERPLT